MSTKISPATHILIKGANQHNLKNVDLTIPKNQLVVFSGMSGSGKSSLAFDTIYAEGQRRYVESLSSYARQFLGIMDKPQVDQIEGLSPAISIDQKTTSHNPRSTVGTTTEIYDYLRLLFARIGHPVCPNDGTTIAPQSSDQIVDQIISKIESAIALGDQTYWYISAPLLKDKRGEFAGLFENLKKKGFQRVRVDGKTIELSQDISLIKTNRHDIDLIIDRLSVNKRSIRHDGIDQLKKRITNAVEISLNETDGKVVLVEIQDASLTFPVNPSQYQETLFSQHLACPQCGYNFPEIEPRMFSFNTPHGACQTCDGLGKLLKINPPSIIAPDLTLTEGAIIPLANALSTDSWYARKMIAILSYHHVPKDTPFKDIPPEVQNIILYGSNTKYAVTGNNKQGNTVSFTFEPEGIIPELERRYQETQSDFMRREIGRFMVKKKCPDCGGDRLKPEALAIKLTHKSIAQITQLSIKDAHSWITQIQQQIDSPSDTTFSPNEKQIAADIVKEIKSRLNFLDAVGLSYLSLSRESGTLAGGEAQRIRLASQIGTGLTGVLYVLDEPTIGLHPRDNDRLISTLLALKKLGNTVLVVEHDQKVIETADLIIDFGPMAGDKGGQIVALGTKSDIMSAPQSITGQYLSGKKKIDAATLRKHRNSLHKSLVRLDSPPPQQGNIQLIGASSHNLKNISVEIPLGKLVAITGVSGSGKSTLIHDTLYKALKIQLGQKVRSVGKYTRLHGAANIERVYMIDQSPIGKTPRSNPATYTKVFDHIRMVYAQTKEAKAAGFKPGRFSFNVKGGRCEACQGGGQIKISMQFLSDVYVTCEVCKGNRYNQATLEVDYKGKNIAQTLNMSVDAAMQHFSTYSNITKRLATLQAVGLGYMSLGQAAPTLSGGESQRVKLAKELSLNSLGHTVYLLDEPTTGLHFEDVKNLLVVLKQLVANQNTVIVIEHNIDVIKNADWLIDLGPEGGQEGGQIVTQGTPAAVAHSNLGYTSGYLAQALSD